MVRHWGCFRTFLMVSMCLLLGISGFGALETEPLFSQNTADLFIRQAQLIHGQQRLDSQCIEQAMVFLDAALSLDEMSTQVPEQILRIAPSAAYSDKDYSRSVYWALQRQVDARADLTLLNGAVQYLLQQQNSRLDREVLLEELLRKYASLNEVFSSDLATQLGLLAVEKADLETATNRLSYAYNVNPYNQLAFKKLQELLPSQGLSVTPSTYLMGLRISLDLNPYDLSGAVEYADTLNRLQSYDAAMGAYDYAAKLFEFLYPDRPLDEAIFLPWILCAYQAPRQEMTCLDVIERYRDRRDFDLTAEAVAGKTWEKLGRSEKANQILARAGKEAERRLTEKRLHRPVYPEQLAWFYSFVTKDPDKALAWANRAFKEAPTRQGVKEIFAYALAKSGQVELAKEYAAGSQQTSQVAAITLALVESAAGNNTEAISLLKSAIEMAPESFVAAEASQRLTEKGSDYIAPTYAATAVQDLNTAFEQRMVPQFLTPQQRLSPKLVFGGSEFFYGNELQPKLSIENRSASPLVIGPGAALQGRLQVDAVLTGDLNVKIPNVLSMSFRPSRPVMPGEHVSIPLPVETGKLHRILLTYPQANVELAFTVYLDPVADAAGNIQNALPGLPPVVDRIQRSGVNLTRDFLMQRLDALSKGRPGQQFRAVQLFSGLLAEQKAFQMSGATFRHVQVDQTLLTDSVRRALKDENWKVRIEAMDSLLMLSVPLDADLIADISQNLNHDQWPVRLMAMYLLARAQPGSFGKVLDWTAQYDGHWLNRRMAIALGAKEPETAQPDLKP